MYIVAVQTAGGHRLHRLGLGYLFGRQTVTVQHIEKVGVAAGIELVGALQLDPAFRKQVSQYAVGNGCPQLGFNIIADKGQAGLFKMVRIPSFRIAGDKKPECC